MVSFNFFYKGIRKRNFFGKQFLIHSVQHVNLNVYTGKKRSLLFVKDRSKAKAVRARSFAPFNAEPDETCVKIRSRRKSNFIFHLHYGAKGENCETSRFAESITGRDDRAHRKEVGWRHTQVPHHLLNQGCIRQGSRKTSRVGRAHTHSLPMSCQQWHYSRLMLPP